jgi:hypothetical protein
LSAGYDLAFGNHVLDILAGLLFYVCLWIDYRLFTYDVERRVARLMPHPVRVLAISCLVLSANIVLFVLKIVY